jgi:hypothetical protein
MPPSCSTCSHGREQRTSFGQNFLYFSGVAYRLRGEAQFPEVNLRARGELLESLL